jgi:hypothetical protein
MDFTELVQQLGIDKLPEDEQKAVLAQVFASLQMRVGQRLAEVLTPEQQKQIEQVANEKGDEAAFDELERLYPDYKKLYQEELDTIKNDVLALTPPQSS